MIPSLLDEGSIRTTPAESVLGESELQQPSEGLAPASAIPPTTKHTINSLQAGRGLAALAVVVLHSSIAARFFGGSFLPYSVFQYGYLGVDFFFVLSGFIIYHSTAGKGRTVRDYAIARFRRVYLPYWPIGIGLALLYVAMPWASLGSRNWAWLPTLTLLPVDSVPALGVAWTLKHEILFYLLFGLFYFSRLLPLGLGIWAVGILLSEQQLIFKDVNLEFFMGIAACLLYRARKAPWWLVLLAPIPLIAWILIAPDVAHRAWVGGTFALLVAPLAQLERRGLSVSKPLLILGAASYSLYLVHEPLILITARLATGSWMVFSACVAVSLTAGLVYHFTVEAWAIRKRSNPEIFEGRQHRPTPVAGLMRLWNRQVPGEAR